MVLFVGPLGHLGGLRLALLSATFLSASFLFFFFMNLLACRVVRFIRNSGSPYYRVVTVADLGTGGFVGMRCPALFLRWPIAE